MAKGTLSPNDMAVSLAMAPTHHQTKIVLGALKAANLKPKIELEIVRTACNYVTCGSVEEALLAVRQLELEVQIDPRDKESKRDLADWRKDLARFERLDREDEAWVEEFKERLAQFVKSQRPTHNRKSKAAPPTI